MITFQNVTFTFDETEQNALDQVNLHIKQGELLLVTGLSGSGKTSLTRCINGIIPHFQEGNFSGQVRIGEMSVADHEIHEVAERVGSVFQDPRSQFFTTHTTAEVAFGCENMGVPREEMVARVEETFVTLGIQHLKQRSLFQLSSGEKQKIALASAYAMQPAIFVLDEPSANLDISSTRQLAAILARLKEQGHTIVIAEHRLYYLRNAIDRVVYMQDGRIERVYDAQTFCSFSAEQLTGLGLRQLSFEHLHVQLEEKNVYKEKAGTPDSIRVKTDEPVKANEFSLVLERIRVGFHKKKDVLQDISCSVSAGEIVGIVGPNGAGKTTLAKVICGLLKEKEGRIRINGAPVNANRRNRHAYFVMQDADYQLFAESVEAELTLGLQRKQISEKRRDAILDDMGLAGMRDRHPAALSGGQKQRLTISVALARQADILIFDEPTSGLDGQNMRRVSTQMIDLARQGKIVLVISHDYEWLLASCSRILHLQDGRVQHDFELVPESVPVLQQILFV
jgi:energy-coupling factor transporter ATP-binding protein EcfA2